MSIYYILAASTLAFCILLLLPVFYAKDINRQQKQTSAIVIITIFMGGGLFLYSQLGTPEIIPLLAKREEKLAILKERITFNSEAVKKDPKNLRSWLELGDSFMETSQFFAASNAYKQAVLLSNGNPAVIMAYARAQIANENGTVSKDAKKGLEIVILQQPVSEEARYYLALYELQSGNSQKAMQDMKSLYQSLPDDSPVKDLIDRQIGRK